MRTTSAIATRMAMRGDADVDGAGDDDAISFRRERVNNPTAPLRKFRQKIR